MKSLITGASLLALLAAAPAAFAQTAVVDETVEEVIVTGTRSTARTVTQSLAPIDVLPAADLIKSGRQSPRDLISTQIPSATTSNSGAGASFAVKTVSLRGLNADQVLVLVNGKRRHNTAILFVNGTTQNGQSPPDLDLIPSAGIDRIEVLRDGASAQYGSDALAGVVNIILKNRPSGGSLSAMAGRTFHGDGDVGQLSGNIGIPLGDGGVEPDRRHPRPGLRRPRPPLSRDLLPAGGRPPRPAGGHRQPQDQPHRPAGDPGLFHGLRRLHPLHGPGALRLRYRLASQLAGLADAAAARQRGQHHLDLPGGLFAQA
jgi:outer membrane receptor protein involved in Fe transport